MRILHLVNDAQTGGAQTLIEALGRQRLPDDEVHLLVLMGPGALSERFEQSADSVSYVGMGQRDVLPLRAMVALRRLVRAHRIDVVHSHLLQSDLVSAITPLRAARVSTVHTSGSHETRSVSRLVGKVVARLNRRFTVVACSPSALDYAVEAGYRPGIEIIRNGTEMVPNTTNAVPGRVLGQRFVQLARWHPMKGHETLFAALALLRGSHPGVRLDCAGLGMDEQNPQLRAMMMRHGVADLVTLHGSVQRVQDLFAEARALVIASTHGEALPMAGIEALSAALPVLSTDVGDCAELVVSGEFLVQPGAPVELAGALARMLDLTPEDYGEKSRAARALGEARYDEAATAAQYRALYTRILPDGAEAR